MDEELAAAKIDNDKCISCGACVYQCPFGAISDKSYILDVIDHDQTQRRATRTIKCTRSSRPSISSQFTYAKLGQVITGHRSSSGFHHCH